MQQCCKFGKSKYYVYLPAKHNNMNNTLITGDRLEQLVNLCKQTPPGLCAEVGVYKGGSLKYLAQNCTDREFWGFDTFEGLPAKDWSKDEIHNPNDFNDVSFEYVQAFLKENKNVTLIPGYFPSSMPVQVHDSGLQFSFVHVDTDFYESVKNCIKTFYPILKPGGIMAFDDYEWPNCPGVKRAIEESGLHVYAGKVSYQAHIVKPLL